MQRYWITCACCALFACHARSNQGFSKKPEPARCSDAPTDLSPAAQKTLEDQQLLTAAGDDTAALVRVGEDFVRLARVHAKPAYYAQAEACAEQALVRSPKDIGAQHLLGLVLLNAHRFTQARDLARALLQQHDEDAVAWGILSDAELELGRIPHAIAAAQAMVDRKPNLPSYGRAAHLRWLQGDREGSKRIYQQAIAAGREHKDHEPRAWMIVQGAWVFWHEGDYAGAAAGFQLALREQPDYGPALEGLGRCALSRGDYVVAARWLAKALDLHPLVETAWALGDAHALAGNPRAASVAYARATRLGEREDPRSLSLFLATRNEQPERALELARAAYRERQDVYSKDALAFALFRNAELADAEKLAVEVVASGIPDARLLYHAGVIFRAAGQGARGRDLLQRALTLNPHFDRLLIGATDATLATRD